MRTAVEIFDDAIALNQDNIKTLMEITGIMQAWITETAEALGVEL